MSWTNKDRLTGPVSTVCPTRQPEVDFVRVEAVLDVLPALVAARMDYLGASYREVGRQAGVSFSTVHRFVEGGNDPSFRAAKHLLRWLAVTAPVTASQADRQPHPDVMGTSAQKDAAS